MTDSIGDLTELFARLPGVGSRTAQRFTFYLLSAPEDYVRALGERIKGIRDRVRFCSVCRNLADVDPCPICADGKRDGRQICIVASIPDLWAIEKSGSFRGRYHVLHGLLAPLDGIGPEDLQLNLLRQRVEQGEVEELIVATRPSVEGEVTALLVRQTFEDLPVQISRIASGVPHGGELEYADLKTLEQAFAGRRELK